MKLNCGKINTSFEHDAPEDFLVSQWQRTKRSFVYFAYRWIIACFYILSVVTNLIHAALCSEIQFYYIYLTHWNLVVTMVSTVMQACLVSLHYTGKMKALEMNTALKVQWFLSTSSNMYAFLVTTIYWTVLYRTDINRIDLNNIVVHATNSFVLLINLAIVKAPERFGLFVYPLSCGCVFLFFTWLYPYLGGRNRRGQDFIYPILNWKHEPMIALLAAIGVTIAGALFHGLIFFIARLRVNIHKKYFAVKDEKSETFKLTC